MQVHQKNIKISFLFANKFIMHITRNKTFFIIHELMSKIHRGNKELICKMKKLQPFLNCLNLKKQVHVNAKVSLKKNNDHKCHEAKRQILQENVIICKSNMQNTQRKPFHGHGKTNASQKQCKTTQNQNIHCSARVVLKTCQQ